MRSVAEGEVLGAGAGEVEAVGVGAVQGGIAACRAEAEQHRLTPPYPDPGQVEVGGGEVQRLVQDWWLQA